jgi:GntR family transcriptional regulator/MocR family aminotransferase
MPESQSNSASTASELVLDLGDTGSGPLNQRVKRALRTAIRTGRLESGSVLPPSRQLATDLGCSRWTITEAYAQLAAEGYLESQVGSATRVRWSATDLAIAPASIRPIPTPVLDLAPGLPDLRNFPRQLWADGLRRAVSQTAATDLAHPSAAGQDQLRRTLGGYLERSRGVSLQSANVHVTTGAANAAARVCRVLLAGGITAIAVEDPGWMRMHEVVASTGLEIVPIEVDEHGLQVSELAATGVQAVIATPAHHFPYGVVLSPERRTALLRWAKQNRAWILEDDYDAEFRYDRAPVATIQGMDPTRVVLLGSLSKTLSPALGIGWMVTPRALTDRLAQLERTVTVPPTLDQRAYADILDSGRYDRHLRAARRRYRGRRDTLVAALHAALPECRLTGVAAGLHLLLHLPPRVSASAVVSAGSTRGLKLIPLAAYCHTPVEAGDAALVLGYGDLADSEVGTAVSLLRESVHATMGS